MAKEETLKVAQKAPDTPTIEEVMKKLGEISRQSKYYEAQCRQMAEALASRRMEAMFKILDHSSLFASEVVDACVTEISETMFPTEQESTEEN